MHDATRIRCSAGTRARTGGSALTEFTVLLLVMIPLLFVLPMLGKLIDLRQTGEQASRYASWEATVYQPDELQSAAARAERRFFAAPSSPLRSGNSDSGDSTGNPLWGGVDASSISEWSRKSAVAIEPAATGISSITHDYRHLPLAAQAGELLGRAGKPLSSLDGNEWSLAANGFVRSDVDIVVQGNELLLPGACGDGEMFGCLRSHSVILTDSWGAGTSDQAARRVRSLMPASAADPIGELISTLGNIPVFEELRPLDDTFGRVDMDVLPDYEQVDP